MERPSRKGFKLGAGALLLGALIYSAAAYLILDWYLGTAASMAVTLTFLVTVPAALASFISFLADPERDHGLLWHLRLALLPLLAAIVGGVLLQEGVICILMLLPLWSISVFTAASITYFLRRRKRRTDRLRASALLLLPAITAQAEIAAPLPVSRYEVGESIVIDAPPERIWPLLVSIPHIQPREGRWNVTHDLLGVPRPTQALLETRGSKAVRLAQWGPDVRFEERILESSHESSLRWTFVFTDNSVRDHTDRHIAPDGMHLTIREGSYRLTPLPGGRTKVTLTTRFDLRSPVNWYAAWWGEWLLRDIQGNVLQVIKDRVELPAEARKA